MLHELNDAYVFHNSKRANSKLIHEALSSSQRKCNFRALGIEEAAICL